MAITKHIITNCTESVSATAQKPPVRVYTRAIPPRISIPTRGSKPRVTSANMPNPYNESAGRE